MIRLNLSLLTRGLSQGLDAAGADHQAFAINNLGLQVDMLTL